MTVRKVNKNELAKGLSHHGISVDQAATAIGMPRGMGATDKFFAELTVFLGLSKGRNWNYASIGGKLTAYRLRTGLTRTGLATQFGVCLVTVINWETGKTRVPPYVAAVVGGDHVWDK